MPPRMSTAKNRQPNLAASSSASADSSKKRHTDSAPSSRASAAGSSSKKRKADSESGSQTDGSLDEDGEEHADDNGESNEEGSAEEEQLVEGQGAIGNKRKLVPVRGHQNLTDVPYWTDGQLASEVKRQRGNAQDPVEDFIVALALHKPATADNTRQAFVLRVETAWTGAGLKRENLLAVRGPTRSNEDFLHSMISCSRRITRSSKAP